MQTIAEITQKLENLNYCPTCTMKITNINPREKEQCNHCTWLSSQLSNQKQRILLEIPEDMETVEQLRQYLQNKVSLSLKEQIVIKKDIAQELGLNTIGYIGVSGGTDSTFTVYLLYLMFGNCFSHFHFSNGLEVPLAKENMQIAANFCETEITEYKIEETLIEKCFKACGTALGDPCASCNTLGYMTFAKILTNYYTKSLEIAQKLEKKNILVSETAKKGLNPIYIGAWNEISDSQRGIYSLNVKKVLEILKKKEFFPDIEAHFENKIIERFSQTIDTRVNSNQTIGEKFNIWQYFDISFEDMLRFSEICGWKRPKNTEKSFKAMHYDCHFEIPSEYIISKLDGRTQHDFKRAYDVMTKAITLKDALIMIENHKEMEKPLSSDIGLQKLHIEPTDLDQFGEKRKEFAETFWA